MLHLATDASYDAPIASCGFVITRSGGGSEQLVETGQQVLNTDACERGIDWCATRSEYRALITGVRMALPYTDEPIICYSDNQPVIQAIRGKYDSFEPYFEHAFYSFINRFPDWHITDIDRERNEAAHEQARVGLKIGRDLLENNELQQP